MTYTIVSAIVGVTAVVLALIFTLRRVLIHFMESERESMRDYSVKPKEAQR